MDLIILISLFHIRIDKAQRQKVANGVELVDAVFAIEQYADGLIVAFLHLEDYLSAGAAR